MTKPLVALTGATYSSATICCASWRARAYRVRVLLRSPAVLPANCTNAVIGDLKRPINMAAAFAGVDTIIHSAGLAPRMTGARDDDFRRLNAEATGNLARAAHHAGVRRCIFLSAIRAQADVSTDGALTENGRRFQPMPTGAPNSPPRSNWRAADRFGSLCVSRSCLGRASRGTMATLIRLGAIAAASYSGRSKAPRSLLALEKLLAQSNS
jgi:hypothetical protein